MKKTLFAAALLIGAGLSLPAAAQFQKPEDAVKYRKAGFTVMAAHFSRLGAMANGKMPFDAKAAAANAEIVAQMAPLPWAGFVEGSESVGRSEAKQEVWLEADKFKAGATKMQEELAKLNAAAKTGDLAKLKEAFGPAAQTCKSCHDHFKQK